MDYAKIAHNMPKEETCYESDERAIHSLRTISHYTRHHKSHIPGRKKDIKSPPTTKPIIGPFQEHQMLWRLHDQHASVGTRL